MHTRLVLFFALSFSMIPALAPLASADEPVGKDWRIRFHSASMEPAGADTILNGDADVARPFHLGESVKVTLPLCNDHAAEATNVRVTLASSDPVFTGIRSMTDNTPQSPATTAPSGACINFSWRVNLSNAGSIGRHPMTFTIDFERPAGTPLQQTGGFDLYVSSAFETRRTVHSFPAVRPASGSFFFAPEARALAEWSPEHHRPIVDHSVTISSLPNGVTAHGGVTTARRDSIGAYKWALDFAALSPGTYPVQLSAMYTVSKGTAFERVITETGIPSQIAVKATPIVTASTASPVTVNAPSTVSIPITFKNDGNVELRDLKVRPAAPDPSDPIVIPATFREAGQSTGVPELDLGTLAPGATTTATLTLVVPEGVTPMKYRVAFEWEGHAFAALASPSESRWYHFFGSPVDHDGDPRTPRTTLVQFDYGPGLANPIQRYRASSPSAFFDMTLAPPFSFSATMPDPVMTHADIVLTNAPVQIHNPTRMDFVDVVVKLPAGPDQPFLAPGSKAADTILSARSPGRLAAGASQLYLVTLDVNPAWMEANAAPAGSRKIPVKFDATDSLGVRHTDIPGFLVFETRGSGPALVVENVTNTPFHGGQSFWLNFTVRNRGDDVARSVHLAASADRHTEMTALDRELPDLAPKRSVNVSLRVRGASLVQAASAAAVGVSLNWISPGGEAGSKMATLQIFPGLRLTPSTLTADVAPFDGWATTEGLALKGTMASGLGFDLADLKVELKIGNGTPFWRRADPNATRAAAENLLTIRADSVTPFRFIVDVNEAWFAANDPIPANVRGTLFVSGRNPETGAAFANLTLPITIPIVGRGAAVVLTDSKVVEGDFAPGDSFTLELRFKNTGDRIVRDFTVRVTNPGVGRLTDALVSTQRDTRLNVSDLGLRSFTDLIAAERFFRGIFASPSPAMGSTVVDKIAPGEEVTVRIQMTSDANLLRGFPYPEVVSWSGTGLASGSATVTVKTGKSVPVGDIGNASKFIGGGGGVDHLAGRAAPAVPTLLVGLGVVAAAALVRRKR